MKSLLDDIFSFTSCSPKTKTKKISMKEEKTGKKDKQIVKHRSIKDYMLLAML